MLRLSIKTKLTAMISILVLGFALFNVAYYPQRVERQVRAQAELGARQVAETAACALAGDNREEIARVLEGLRGITAFQFGVVFDNHGRAVAATPSVPVWAVDYARSPSSAGFRGQDACLVASATVQGQGLEGTLVVGFSSEAIRQLTGANVRQGLMAGMVAMALGLAAAVFLANLYIRPVVQLTAAAQQVSQGNLDGLSVRVRSRDELEDLSRSFEVMTNKLRVSREEIERQNRLLEFRVQERTRQLMETIWELEEIRSNLEHLVLERTKGLEQSRAELSVWAGTLEDKVQEKTQELTEANESLLVSLQRLQTLDRIKDEFLANMSHELRTPLNAVIGFSGLLLQESAARLPEDIRDDLHLIHANGRSLLTMIDSILDLSKLEVGKFEVELEPMDLIPVLESVRALTGGLILDRPIRFRFTPPPWKALVLGDATRFKQVITNLVGNAIKFTEKGDVEMRVTRVGARLRISIRDTGIGMSSEEMARLFKPFQQVDSSITRRFGGTGLGLALSQRLIAMMNGVITVESRKGHGSTFTVELPVLEEQS